MRASIVRWSIVALLLALVTNNLLAQAIPPRGDAYPAPLDPYPGPPQPYPWPPTDPYPGPPQPYPWPTVAPQEAYLPYPVIPTRTPRESGLVLSAKDLTSLILGSVKRQAENVVAPTRDYEWEDEFYAVHNRRPDSQDVADRLWSLGFLARTGRAPTESEWIAHFYER